MSNGADSIRFTCSQCNTTLSASAENAGTLIVCPTCQAKLTVPFPAQPVVQAVSSQPATVQATMGQSAPAPMSDLQTGATTEVASTAVGSSVVADPNATDPERALNTSPKPRTGASGYNRAVGGGSGHNRAVGGGSGYNRAVQGKTKAPPQSSRKPVMVFSAVVVLGVAAFAGVTIKNNMERTATEAEVKTLVDSAKSAFGGNDVTKAFKLASDAKTKITKSAQPLTPELVKGWQASIDHVSKVKQDMDELDKVFATVENDMFNVRARLLNKKELLGKATPENQPLVMQLETMLGKITELEMQRKLKGLRNDLSGADKVYADGNVEGAADKAVKIADEMKKKPVIQDKELESRIDVLKKRAMALQQAKTVRLSARNGNFSDARQKLQAQISGLDEKNADHKPLIARIEQLRTEVNQDEKRAKALPEKEANELRAIATALARRDSKAFDTGTLDGDTVGMAFNKKPVRIGMLEPGTASQRMFVEAENYRFTVNVKDMDRRTHRVFNHVVKLGEAMKKANVPADEVWNAEEEAPLASARRTGTDGQEYIFLGDRLYVGKPQGRTDAEKELQADFERKAEALAKAIENDAPTSEEIRGMTAVAIRATYKDADWYDHLPGEFVRKVVNEGYIENNMPGAGERLKKELAAWREAYKKISVPYSAFNGQDSDANEAQEFRNFEDHAIWRLYDKKADVTTFAIKNPDDEKDCLFILYDFPGKVTDFPKHAPATRVRMTHQAVGVTATYDVAAQKMDFDRDAWYLAAAIEQGLIPEDYRKAKGLGTPEWSLPPHVLVVDIEGSTKSIITPYGKLDVVNFSAIEPAKRQTAMNEFLDKLSKVLPSAGYLHLYFRYMHEYILDSPHTNAQALLGSRQHCGDIHQTTEQSLARFMGGRYVGDCDDLAEFFMNVTRRQGKLSFVMALPQHAACGWVEKPADDSEYIFHIIDTGPPRMFTHKELDKVIEMAFRAYDEDKTMRFDPKSLGFLFRFNGEPTRAPYFLSSRMYTDKPYGETMEEVQGFWHFHFYALGIQKMTEMIEKGDKVPENMIELAGLYGQVHEFEQSIKWTQEALKQVKPHEKLSRMNEEVRIGLMWREAHENEKSFESIKHLLPELKQLQSDPSSLNYLNIRMQLMGLLTSIDRPWDAWDLIIRDIDFIARRGMLRIEHVGGLTGVYEKMKELERKGKAATPGEKGETTKLETLLTWFYGNAVFQREDDFNDYMRKYAFIGKWYAGRLGHEKVVEELLKAGPFPDPAKPRNHMDRRNPEEEDWKWIRLALPSYAMAVGEALDPEEPPEKWRKEEAVKMTDAMLKAAEVAKKFGSLGATEYQLLAARVNRAFIKKDWPDFEAVLKVVQERDWARLTADIAETMGRSAKFVTPAEFAAQYRVFAKYVKARTSYFTVVYEAHRADAPEQAVAAAKVAVELFPKDEDMRREEKFLEQLAKNKLARQAAKAKN